MVARSKIENLAQRIAEEFKPERIILFGSHAYGAPTPDSDVDLFIVMPLDGKGCHKASEIRLKLRPEFPVDLLVRSPHQVKQRLDLGDIFVKEVTEKGEVLYESSNRRVG